MNGLRNNSGTAAEIKYPATCSASNALATANGMVDAEIVGALALSMGATPSTSNANAAAAAVMDKLYEPKPNKKVGRVITVIGYIFSVSMIAIILSLYYLFLWNPYSKRAKKV